MKPKPLYILLLLFCSVLSCEDYSDPDPYYPIDSFYFNSFETSSDTIGWYGINTYDIVKDAPKLGGKYSLKVSGGCVIPHAYFGFDPLKEDCNLVLKCWGKNLSYGGSVGLRTQDYSGSIYIYVSDSSWTSYISEVRIPAIPVKLVLCQIWGLQP